MGAELTVYGTKLKLVSWNVLNHNYMPYIYMDQQGLDGSEITEMDGRKDFSRESKIAASVIKFFSDTEAHVVCLQERSLSFFQVSTRNHRVVCYFLLT